MGGYTGYISLGHAAFFGFGSYALGLLLAAAVVVFARVGPDDEAPTKGAQWLSEMYGLPPRAFERHLVAGSAEACAAGLARFADAGARHIVVMVAGTGAVSHFAPLRAAFTTRTTAVPAGAVPSAV